MTPFSQYLRMARFFTAKVRFQFLRRFMHINIGAFPRTPLSNARATTQLPFGAV